MKNIVQSIFMSWLIIVFTLSLLLKCSQGEKSSKPGGKTISDTSQISSAELALLPAKGPYFPIDERIIEDRWMIERFVVSLEKNPNNPLMTKDFPWEGTGPLGGGTVIFDQQDKLFKIWYGVWDKNAYYNGLPFSYNICYAESREGIVWEKPLLGLFDRRGTMDKNNNCIVLGR